MEKHDLHHEFPQFDQKIHDLKVSNHHFKKLFDDYHAINNEIYRIESGNEPTSDDVLNQNRAKRVHLKDELYALLSA
ncbi:MAG: DUF465 domain-containing protein [Bacteroidota bacterium]|nr:DUF465 domain-containing protein [Bacteroidota bacterium]